MKYVFGGLSIAAILVIILTPVFMWRYIWLNSCKDVVAHVTEKENVVHSQESKYLIFTEEETFQNEDELFIGKFDSSDYYRHIEPGKEYNFRVCGWRIPPLSMYRNIIEINE